MKRLIMIVAITLVTISTYAQPVKHVADPTQPVVERLTFVVPRQFSTIQEAIDRASDGFVILVTPGTYEENIDFRGKAITVRSDADGDPKTYDISPEDTVIDGFYPVDPNIASAVTFASNEGNDSVLDGFGIQKGAGTYDASINGSHGGGVYCDGTSPTITNNRFKNNAAAGGGGGGIYSRNGSPVIQGNDFFQNAAYFGGGIYIGDAASTVTLENNDFVEQTVWVAGGAVYCENSDIIVGPGQTFYDNTAGFSHGGALMAFNCSCEIQEGNLFALNETPNHGGAVCFDSCPFVTVRGSTFTSNIGGRGGNMALDNSYAVIEDNEIVAGGVPVMHIHHWGGGIWCKDAQIEIVGNRIADNESPYGGGMYCETTTGFIDDNVFNHNWSNDDGTGRGGALYLVGSDLTLTNNLITDNSALSSAGGIYCYDFTTVELTNNTFADNYSNNSGIAITAREYCTVTCTNCIFYQPSTQYEIAIWDSEITLGFSLISDAETGLWADVDSIVNLAGGMMYCDPLFVSGLQGHYYLSQIDAGQSVDSWCVDGGDPASLMIDGTTRTDEVPDMSFVDMGFHYPTE